MPEEKKHRLKLHPKCKDCEYDCKQYVISKDAEIIMCKKVKEKK